MEPTSCPRSLRGRQPWAGKFRSTPFPAIISPYSRSGRLLRVASPVNKTVFPKAAAMGTRNRKVEADSPQSSRTGSLSWSNRARIERIVAAKSSDVPSSTPCTSLTPEPFSTANDAAINSRWAMLLLGGTVTTPCRELGPTKTLFTTPHLPQKLL